MGQKELPYYIYSKRNQIKHWSGRNKRNNDHTNQARAAKRPEFQRQTVKEKSSRNKNRVRELPSDDDKDLKKRNKPIEEDWETDDEESTRIDKVPTKRPENSDQEEGQNIIILH